MTTHYCPTCDADTRCKIEVRSERYPVRGEEIPVEASILVCSQCGQDILDPFYDDVNLKKAYELYRSKHGILNSDGIKTIREQYGLSQRGLSRLLGWGEITIHRYEAGGVPSSAQNALLTMISTVDGMAEYLRAQGHAVPAEERRMVEKVLERLEPPNMPIADTFAQMHENLGPSIMTGYRKFNFDRLRQVIRFFASDKPVYKTKLNKLIWYADFLSFKRTTLSISGMPYVRLQYGPVPKYYGAMYDSLEENGDIDVIYDPWANGEMVSALEKPDLSLFSSQEWEVLRVVREVFANDTSGTISDKSHKEVAWIQCPQGNLISYEYANELHLN